ncbi:hypothetical protein M8C13_32685 [Crossiella sp. SN42]|uniref:hypothetical protein n=1 Tax=Crossiella sp. SN42 TaxID=2944808 RepID=UPI00207CB173|nr:hypothetical protein [Crossiella sp. SN42]MCO1580522.1 hypothetical protein [Crossiella sp. SN42]
MSFRPLTVWTVQCGGLQQHGPCVERLYWLDTEDKLVRAQLDEPKLSASQVRWLNTAGWMVLPDGRHRCPGHVAMAEHLVQAAFEGPSFNERRLR